MLFDDCTEQELSVYIEGYGNDEKEAMALYIGFALIVFAEWQ
ncbi:MAG: hypothetical protein SPI25_00395 [Dialister sp.]|nr:hypothetical protein [Dialister sp.]